MKSLKLKKLIALTLAIVMTLSCLPTISLVASAEVATAADAAAAVRALNYYVGSDKATYESWLTLLQTDEETYASEISRLSAGIASLTDGIDYYDDLTNLGVNDQSSQGQPTNRMDPYLQSDGSADAADTATWEILWGGLESTAYGSGSGQKWNDYSLPNTIPFSNWGSATTLFFHPYQYNYWYSGAADGDINLTPDNAYGITTSDDTVRAKNYFKTLLGSLNWASPVGEIHEGQVINSVVGSARIMASPAIIYDYKDGSNYAYLVLDNRDYQSDNNKQRRQVFKAVVVEEGVGREVVLWDSGEWLYPYQGLTRWEDIQYIADFDLTWNTTSNCYVFTFTFPENNDTNNYMGYVQGQSAHTTSNNVVTLTLDGNIKDTSGNDADILVNAAPKKLEKLMITTSLEANYYDKGPSYSRIAIDYEISCDHANLETNPKTATNNRTPADCQADATWYNVCADCGQVLESYWTETDSQLAHDNEGTLTADNWRYDANGHWTVCTMCESNIQNESSHSFANNPPADGDTCACGFVHSAVGVEQLLAQINALKVFVREDLDTYKSMLIPLESLKDNATYAAAYARLEHAVEQLEAADKTVDVYDDLTNVGANNQVSENGQPDNKMDPFKQSDGSADAAETATWEILWGGLPNSQMDGNQWKSYSLPNAATGGNSTWKGINTLYFYPFQHQYWKYDGSNRVELTSGDWATLTEENREADYFKTMLGSLNWATPVGTAHEDKVVNSVSGSARMVLSPALIYDYKDADNYAYILLDNLQENGGKNTQVKVVVVENGVGREEILWDSGENIYLYRGLNAWEQATWLYDFDLTWNDDYSAYVFTVKLPRHMADSDWELPAVQGIGAYNYDNGTYTFVLDRNITDVNGNKVDILANDAPMMLEQVMITTSVDSPWYDIAPAYSQIAIDYSEYCAHEHYSQVAADKYIKDYETCETERVYYCVCDNCGQKVVTQTWTATDTMLTHTAAEDWGVTETQHWQVCKYCGDTMEGSTGDHDYGVHGQKPGNQCYDCHYIYGQDVLEISVNFIKNIQYFTMENIGLYEYHLKQMEGVATEEGYQEYYDRLARGIENLKVNGTTYDDLSNIGSYNANTSTDGMEKWDAFADTTDTGDNTWEILWGGLNGNQTNTYTLPGSYVNDGYNENGVNAPNLTVENTLVFKPFHFNNITVEGYSSGSEDWRLPTGGSALADGEMNFNEGYQWGYIKKDNGSYDYTALLGGLNWATPTYVSDTQVVEQVHGSGKMVSRPTLIFDYKDPDNYSYITVLAADGGSYHVYFTAVVVENGKAIREVVLAQATDNAYERNVMTGNGVAQQHMLFDFDMVWDYTENCYRLDIVLSTLTNLEQTVTPGSSVIKEGKVLDSIYLKNDSSRRIYGTTEAEPSADILVNETARKVPSVYVSTDIRGYHQGKAPLTNIGITMVDADHVHVYDQQVISKAHTKIAADCSQTGTYYYSCTCGLNGEDTFAGTELGDHIEVDALGYNTTQHYNYCAVCYQVLNTVEDHRMDNHECYVCHYRDDVDQSTFAPIVEGGAVLAGTTPVDNQKLRIFVDFSNIIYAKDAGIEIDEYGLAVMYVPQNGITKLQLETNIKMEYSGTKRWSYHEGDQPGVMRVTLDVGAEHYGYRVALIAYLRDTSGHYYFSTNDTNSNNSNLNGALDNGMIQTGVMRVIKNILNDTDTTTGYNHKIDSAFATYFASANCSAEVQALGENEAKQLLTDYLAGTISGADTNYALAKEICLWVFKYCA